MSGSSVTRKRTVSPASNRRNDARALPVGCENSFGSNLSSGRTTLPRVSTDERKLASEAIASPGLISASALST